MQKEQLVPFSIQIPESVHRAARLKSLLTDKSINRFVNEKLAEWVNEPEPRDEPTARKQPRRAKQPA
jgi:hypothetical protein